MVVSLQVPFLISLSSIIADPPVVEFKNTGCNIRHEFLPRSKSTMITMPVDRFSDRRWKAWKGSNGLLVWLTVVLSLKFPNEEAGRR